MSAEVLPRAIEEFRNSQGAAKTEIWRKRKDEIIWQGREDERRAAKKNQKKHR